MKVLPLLAALTFIHFTGGRIIHNRYVIDLTWANFTTTVLQSNSIWIVKFYAPWCTHSAKAAPEYSKAAKALDGVIKVGAVNTEIRRDLSILYDVKGIPAFKIFGRDKANPKNFSESRTAASFVKAGMEAANEKVMAALQYYG